MTAKEAFELATWKRLSLSLRYDIEETAEKGNFSIEYSHQLDDNDRKNLQYLGFCVTFDGSITRIKW